MIIHFHTPGGVVIIDSETVTDAELAALGLTRDEFNEQFALLDTARAEVILSTSPAVISQVEIWELLRIFGRRLGYDF